MNIVLGVYLHIHVLNYTPAFLIERFITLWYQNYVLDPPSFFFFLMEPLTMKAALNSLLMWKLHYLYIPNRETF